MNVELDQLKNLIASWIQPWKMNVKNQNNRFFLSYLTWFARSEVERSQLTGANLGFPGAIRARFLLYQLYRKCGYHTVLPSQKPMRPESLLRVTKLSLESNPVNEAPVKFQFNFMTPWPTFLFSNLIFRLQHQLRNGLKCVFWAT